MLNPALTKKYLFILFSVFFAVLASAVLVWMLRVEEVNAQRAPDEIYGYAWSDNIGWISFNVCNDYSTYDECQAIINSGEIYSYKVKVDLDTGELEGFAWSDAIGWIRFGGLSDFPTGGGTNPTNAQFAFEGDDEENPIYYGLTGWARSCVGTIDPDNCDDMTDSPDGWDGWINLSGSDHGVTYEQETGYFGGYAYGSDVLGWISFSGDGYQVSFDGFPASEEVNFNYFYSAPSSIPGDGRTKTTLHWEVEGAEYCVASGEWSGNKDTSGNEDQGPYLEPDGEFDEYEFALSCYDSSGDFAYDTAVVTVYSEAEFPNTSGCEISEGSKFVGHEVTWAVYVENPEEFTYEWSGDLGSADPGNGSSFTTRYSTVGVKEITVDVKNAEYEEVFRSESCSETINVDVTFEIF